jgi:hypothetical protein
MGRRRAALAAGLTLFQLGALACGALGAGERSLAPGTIHAAALVDRVDGPLPSAGPPCHEAHGSGAQARPRVPLTLNERCPCGCGGLPGAALDHGGSGPALLAVRDAIAWPTLRVRVAASVASAPAAPAHSVDHVPILV